MKAIILLVILTDLLTVLVCFGVALGSFSNKSIVAEIHAPKKGNIAKSKSQPKLKANAPKIDTTVNKPRKVVVELIFLLGVFVFLFIEYILSQNIFYHKV